MKQAELTKLRLEHEKRMFSLRYKQIIDDIEQQGYAIFGITRKDFAKKLIKFIEANYNLKCEVKHNGYGRTDIIIKCL